MNLLTKQWQNSIYEKSYKGVFLAQLAHTMFCHRNSDEKLFVEFYTDYIKENDDKIKSISVNIEPFNTGTDSLDDVLIHSNYALNAYYNG